MLRLLLAMPVVALVMVAISLWPEPTPAPIKIGILHSLTGTMAISEKPVMEATLLAVEQVNAAGGVLGRQIEPVVVDGKSDPTTFAREAERLISEEHVSALFGCWTSACRKMVKPVVERHHSLLFYPVQYEGIEDSSNIVYLGAVPNQQMMPAVSWAMKQFGPRFFFVGSDYVFPRVAHWLMRAQVQMMGGKVVGERYLPLGSRDVAAIVEEIRRVKPSVVVNTINGDSNIAFFHALHEAGIRADRVPVVSLSIGETELASFHHDGDGVGHYAAWNYFQSIDNDNNRAFITEFRARFGQDRVLTDPMEAAWAGVHLWARAVRSAQSDDPAMIREAIAPQSIDAPEGVLSVDRATRHLWKTVRIGKIEENHQFSVVWQSAAPVRPDPFPALINKRRAEAFLQKLYDGWGQRWSRPADAVTP